MKKLNKLFFIGIISSLALFSCQPEENEDILVKVPEVSTMEVSNIDAPEALCGGIVEDDGGAAIIEQGLCWSSTAPTTTNEFTTTENLESAVFYSKLTNLDLNTTYYVRAYAKNKKGIGYGESKAFTANIHGSISVLTESTTETSAYTTVASAIITNNSTKEILEQGFCWSLTSEPNTKDNKIISNQSLSQFADSIKSLNPKSTYFIRAYANILDSTIYGNVLNFTTKDGIISLTTTSVSEIGTTSTKTGGNIQDDGGSSITSRGVCWSTNQNPTINDNKTLDGLNIGSFTSNMASLSPNTTYYVKAYAVNGEGIQYGNEISFTTRDGVINIQTTNASNIGATTANTGGNIQDDGGSSITSRGVCWSTNQSPTINDNKTINGTSLGAFTSNMTNLLPNTTYYVKSYAVNSEGIQYGNETSFTTMREIETLTLQPGATDGKDAYLVSLNPDVIGGSSVDFIATAWTNSGNPVLVRSVIDFDLSAIPEGSTIISAQLSLFNNPTSLNNNGNHSTDGAHDVLPHNGADNGAYLRRITSDWNESTVTWNNQPIHTTTNQVFISPSTSAHQDYENIDVKNLVQDMVNDKANSFGFKLTLETEEYYRCLIFASSDHADSAKHPKLVVTYYK